MKINTPLRDLVPMKYYSFPAGYSAERKAQQLNSLLATGRYIYSLKTDGNWGRAIIQPNGDFVIQSRGISKVTGEYGELQDKLLFADAIKEAFTDTTLLIGEIYLDEGRDKDVGSILRCLPNKAIARQTGKNVLKYRIFDCWYYNGFSLMDAPIIERIKYLPKAVEAINHPLVSYVKYYRAESSTFYDRLNSIFELGGEGVVLYREDMRPCTDRTPAWQTLKIKQEMAVDADCFIYGVEEAEKYYTGKDVTTWQYWMNDKTGERFFGSYYLDYYDGGALIPITKNYYYNWPGAIKCAVYNDKHEPVIICKCSGLTEEFKTELRDNYNSLHMCPIKISGMMISQDRDGNYSIRHPKLVSLRESDIDIEDCTLSKIISH